MDAVVTTILDALALLLFAAGVGVGLAVAVGLWAGLGGAGIVIYGGVRAAEWFAARAGRGEAP